jgi:hypothetical protein
VTIQFFHVIADPAATARWFLRAPTTSEGKELDARMFITGDRVDVSGPLRIFPRRLGEVVDFNFCDFDMVVTPADVNAELEKRVGSAIQRIPVDVEGSVRRFEILNVCRRIQCLDETRSQTMKWGEEDGRPDKVGQYRMVLELKIDVSAAAGQGIFRVAEWPMALIISSEIKELFEQRRLSGVVYVPVY